MTSRYRSEGVLAQVERAALRTELLERAHAWTPRPKRAALPVVTIAREHGALGSLADRVGAELGFRVWNREILEAIARASGTRGDRLESNDEHPHNALDETLTDWIFGPDRSQTHYLSVLRDVARSIVHEGSAVIVGRGANFLVPEDSALRVRVVAPIGARVAAIAAQKGMRERDALREVRHVDHDRTEFVRRAFRKDARDPTEYDLVVNTGTMPVEIAARVVVDCYRDRFGDAYRTAVEAAREAARA